MNIDHYIEQLSHTEDCFTIFGLGGFICNNSGVLVHPVTHKFIPPARKIAFNSSLVNPDLKLENLIMQTEGISIEMAKNTIQQYVDCIFQKLNSTNTFEIKNIGRLYKNHFGNLEFEQNLTSNLLDDSFGLPDLFYKPIERETMRNRAPKSKNQEDPSILENKKLNRKYAMILLPFAVIFGIGAVLYGTQDQDTSIAKLLSIGSISGLMDTTSSSISALKEGSVTTSSNEEFSVEISDDSSMERGINMVSEVDTISTTTSDFDQPVTETIPVVTETFTDKNYTIIIGAFSQKDNADKLYNKISADQVQVSIIEPTNKSSLYKIAVGSFANIESAVQDLENIRSQYGSGAWVMAVK